MSDFFRFWLDCLLKGVTVFEGVFLWAELLCIGTWLFCKYVYRKYWSKKDSKQREEAIEKYAKRIAIALLVIGTIVVAPFIQFKDEKDARIKAQQALKDEAPKLDGFIDQSLIAHELGLTNSFVLLQVSIGNSGRAASIARNFELMFLTNQTSVEADLIHFSDEYKIVALELTRFDGHLGGGAL